MNFKKLMQTDVRDIGKIFTRVEEIKSAPVIVPVSQGSFLEFAFTGGQITARKAFEFYRSNSAVATAVDLIADSFEQIKPVLKIGDKFVSDHPVLDLLNNPNGFMTWQRFAGNISRNYLLTHNSHMSAIGNTKREPIEVWPVKPINVSAQQDSDLYPNAYQISQGKGHGNYLRNEKARQMTRFIDAPLKELYHIMGYSSLSNEMSGDSPLMAAALDAKQQIQSRIHNLQMVNNGGRLSLVISFSDTMTDKQHQERKERVDEQFGGAMNAGKIGVISGKDMKIDEFGKSNKDMDYREMEKTANQAIYMRYKIPLPLVTTSASTFNNFQSAVVALYDFAVLPMADTLFAGLSMFLLPRYGLDPSQVQVTYDPESITALMARRLEQLEKRKQIGVETTNELRKQLPNRGPVENGDTVLVPVNLVPLGEEDEGLIDEEEEARLLREAGIE